MKNRSKMILGLASLLGVTAGATAVSGFAWFVTTKTADVEVTKIGVYNNNPSLSVLVGGLKGVKRTNSAANDFNLEAGKDSTSFTESATGDGTKTAFVLTNIPLNTPKAYVDGVETAGTYTSADHTFTFNAAPANNAKIEFVYVDNAPLTDVSSIDGVNIYDPTWQTAYEGLKATRIPKATAGEQYISFDLTFKAVETGSLKIFLDRPTIKAKETNTTAADTEAADVARVGFSIGGSNVLTISNKQHDDEGYEKGIDSTKVASYPTAGDDQGRNCETQDAVQGYTVANVLSNCQNLWKPSLDNYSIRSTAPAADAEHMYITTVSNADVIVHVSIWLEGTSNVDALTGNNSDPIGGEINVKLPIVAFGA